MAQISRLHDAQIQNGLVINAGDISDELNQLVTEANSKDTKITTIMSGSFVQSGTLTTTNNLVTNGISERTAGNGVVVDSTRLQDGYANLQSILSTITAVNTVTDTCTAVAHGLSTGQAVRIRALGSASVLPGGTNSTTTYYVNSVTVDTFRLYNSSANATLGGATGLIDLTAGFAGVVQVVGKAASYKEGDVYVSQTGLSFWFNGAEQPIATTNTPLPPTGYRGSAAPVYQTATTFSVASILERDSSDTSNIIKTASTTVDITTLGLNGIAQSANLTGTVTVTSGSTAVTFSTSQTGVLIVGDVLTTAGGQARRLTAVSGTSGTVESNFATTETAVTFKRGGRASFNTAATSGAVGGIHYYLYAITDGSTPGLILSTRNVAGGETLVDLPTGYTISRQLAFSVCLANMSTAAGVYVGNIIPFSVGPGWPYRPNIRYTTKMSARDQSTTNFNAVQTNVLAAGSTTTYTSVNLKLFQPNISKEVDLNVFTPPSNLVFLRITGGNDLQTVGTAATLTHLQVLRLPTPAQSIDYRLDAAGSTNFDVLGFVVTEVP